VDLADIATPENIEFTQRAERPWAPSAITADPTSFTTWDDITISWTPRIKTRTTTPRFPGVHWSIQVRDESDTVDDYVEIETKPYTGSSVVLTAANLESALGSTPVSFYARVVGVSGSLTSLYYPEVLVEVTA
jgi:hypothetical protein